MEIPIRFVFLAPTEKSKKCKLGVQIVSTFFTLQDALISNPLSLTVSVWCLFKEKGYVGKLIVKKWKKEMLNANGMWGPDASCHHY